MWNNIKIKNKKKWKCFACNRVNEKKEFIKKITIVTWTWVKVFEVWIDDVTEIANNWIEYEDTIHYIYTIKDSWENIVAQIENCPVVLEYKNK